MSDSLQPNELQHTKLPCPSPSPGACSDLFPLSQWCHPAISSSVVTFSSCPQSLPTSGSFLMSQFFTSDGQSIRASASASVLPINIQGWFLSDWLVLSPFSPKDSQESSPTPQFKSINSSAFSFLHNPTLTSITGKTIALTRRTFVGKAMSLLCNMLSKSDFVVMKMKYSISW